MQRVTVTVVAMGSLVTKAVVVTTEQVTEICCHSSCMDGIVSSCFSFSCQAVSGKTVCSLHSSYPRERNFFQLGSFLLVLGNASLGDGVMQTNGNYSSSPFCAVILKVFCYIVLLNFFQVDLKVLPELFLFINNSLLVNLCSGMETGSPICHLGDVTLTY